MSRLRIFGDSMGVGQGASSASEGWAYRFGRRVDMPLVNHALSGSGSFEASKQGFIASGQKREAGIYACMAGFNDLNSGGIHPGTLTKIQGCHRAFLANAFLRQAVPASDSTVTKSGIWSNASSAFFCKAEIGLCGHGLTTNVYGNGLTWPFTIGAAESLIVGTTNSDGTNYDGSGQRLAQIKVSIDGVTILGYYCGDGMSDGRPNGLDDERMTHEALIYPNLAAGSHTVTVDLPGVPGATGYQAIVDYFGIMAAPSACQPVLIGEVPYFTAAPGIAVSRPNAQQASIAIQQVINQFPDYPIRFVRVNDWYDAECDAFTDGVHPNDYGHKRIARAFLESYKTL